jgi:signal transduction histidine kinase
MARSAGDLPVAHPRAHAAERLEEVTRGILEALDSVVAFGHVQSRIRSDRDPAAIFPAARAQLRRLLDFTALGFLTVGEGADFVLVDCEPEPDRARLRQDVEAAIGRGLFASAVSGHRAVTVRSERPGHTLVLQSLVSGSRVVGMFAGVLRDDACDFSQAASNLLSLILFSTAQAFENATLYHRIQMEAQGLEQSVETRTRELRAAYEELSRTKDQLVQAQKIEAVGRLAGGIAHDFNNLLVVITGHSEILKHGLASDDPRRRHAEILGQTADRAAALTHQLLAFSRKQVLQPRELDPNEVVGGMEAMLRRLIGEHIELVTACDRGAGHVRADPGQLEQVIMNLAVNARDAMPEGGRLVLTTSSVDLDAGFVRDHPGSRVGPHVVLEVCDTGTGMDAAVRAHLFEPFFTTKGVGKGTGLGLATVYGIVKQSEGYIQVDSETGRGSRFSIYLPRVAAASAPVVPAAEAPAAPRGAGTILVVEDEEPVRLLVVDILEASGYSLLAAENGLEALEVVGRHAGPIDLVVTDVVMPQMGGRQFAERLGGLRPGTPVLYMSGYPDGAFGPDGFVVPGAAFLQKPFTTAALGREVQALLAARPPAAARADRPPSAL